MLLVITDVDKSYYRRKLAHGVMSYSFIQHRTHRKEKNFRQHLIKLCERDERFPAFPHFFYEISMMGQRAGVRMQSFEDWHQLSLHVSSKHSSFFLCASGLALGSKKNGNLGFSHEVHIILPVSKRLSWARSWFTVHCQWFTQT